MGQRHTSTKVLLAACAVLASCGDDGGGDAQARRGRQLPKASIDLSPLLTSLTSKDYDAAYGWLDHRLQAAWPKTSFREQVGKLREQVGEAWKPERTGFMNSRTPQGPTFSASYKLEENWRTKYSLDVVTVDSGKGPKIVSWTMSSPCDPKDTALDSARRTASEFLTLIRKEEYDKATGMLAAEVRPRVSSGLLAQMKRLFWGAAGDEVAFTEVALSKLINGKWYYSVVAFPKGKEMNFLEVILSPKGDGMSVASFNFKAKVAGPGSTRPPATPRDAKRNQ